MTGANGSRWYRVTYRSERGYILGSLLSSADPVADQSTAQDSEPSPALGPGALADFFPVSPVWESATRDALMTHLGRTKTTAHFTVHYRANTFAEADLGTFAGDAEEAVRHIEQLLELEWSGQADFYLAYALFSPPDSGLRGYTRSYERMIFVLYDGTGTRLDRQYITAHEITHQVARDAIGGASSTMLSEGLAMYTGQRYLLMNGNVSLDGFARAALEQGRLVPLTHLIDGRTGYRGRLFDRYPYDEAGSFVQYLIRTYGVRQFKQVYTSGDFAGVYGKDIGTLEEEWKSYLSSDRAIGPFATDPSRYLQSIGHVQDAYSRLFTALSQGQRVEGRSYAALDAARIASDQGRYQLVILRLREADI